MDTSPMLITAVLQLLFAATWFIIPIVALLYGDRAQEAAEKAVSDHGFDKDSSFKMATSSWNLELSRFCRLL